MGKIKERLAAALPPVQGQAGAGYFYIKGELKGKMIRIDVDQIQFVESLKNYIGIHLEKEVLTTYLTMKEIEAHLPASQFTRVHKSFIVNNAKVKVVEGNQILLDNNKSVMLGASYRTDFLKNVYARLIKSKRSV